MSDIGEALGTAAEGALLGRAIEPKHGEGADGHTHEGACLNCGTILAGPHCHVCGQKAHVHRTIGAFLHDLVLLAAQRAREISGGAELTIDRDRDKNPVVALREIAETTVRPKVLQESLVQSLQRVLPDEEDEADEIGSLSQSAEAMRLSAAAPARSNSVGGDYDG